MAVPDFYRAATSRHWTRCAGCDGRGYYYYPDLGSARFTCQTCDGEGTVSVPALRHYPLIPTRKPKTMADTSLAPSRPLVTCPCCHGRKHLLISVPCLHCEQTGTVQAEVLEPDPYESTPVPLVTKPVTPEPDPCFPPILWDIAKGYANLFTQTDPSPKPPPPTRQSSKPPKRSRHGTRKPVNSGKR